MYKVFFITFGCKVNQYETDSMRSEFVSQGFVETDSADDADIIIINSCTVTGSGDSKSLYSVRKMRKIAPNAIIALTGCLPQAAPEIAPGTGEIRHRRAQAYRGDRSVRSA